MSWGPVKDGGGVGEKERKREKERRGRRGSYFREILLRTMGIYYFLRF